MSDRDSLLDTLHQLLLDAPEGLGEYALLKALRERRFEPLPEGPLSDPLILFRCHFLLFNALYRLRDRLNGEGLAQLEIQPLCIRLLPWRAGQQALAEDDPLRAYYLDESQLGTSAKEVEDLLASFWVRQAAPGDRARALALLKLEDDGELSRRRIRDRYRRLAAEHHPDRGGDARRMVELNEAMEILERYYR